MRRRRGTARGDCTSRDLRPPGSTTLVTGIRPSPEADGTTAGVDRHNCDWADVDRNGLPDAYCSAGRTLENHVKRGQENELWLQKRPGVFREAGAQWLVTDICGRGRAVTFLDANGDRYPDLFLGNEAPRHCADPLRLVFEAAQRGKQALHQRARRAVPLCPEVMALRPGARFEVRGDAELQPRRPRRSVHLPWRKTYPRLYAHLRGCGFVDVTSRNHLQTAINDATVADIDGDHDKDLVTAANRVFGYHLNNHGRFSRLRVIGRPPIGYGWAVAVGDADGDGDNDVYGMIGYENPRDRIWLNHNLHFTAVPVPPARGNADDVITLHPRRRTRQVAFLVLNGRKSPSPGGPVQLIRLVRR